MRSNNKTYYIKHEPHSTSEAEAFIKQYRNGIARAGTRYMSALKFVQAGSYVLDFGCGWGLFSEMMWQQRSCQVDGIDLDPDSIAIAKGIVGEREGLKYSIKGIQAIPDARYITVVSMQVLEHTHNPGNYLMQCNRVLKDGGRLVISVPNILNPRFFLPPLRGNYREKFKRISNEAHTSYDKTHHHIQAWDPSTFCRLLATVGFDYITHEFVEGMALPWGKYWYTKLPGLRNWSYTMVFAAKKTEFIAIADNL